jgi:thioesterase domain-containing protein
MVPLRPGAAKPRLFLIHAVGGSAHSYRDLAEHIGVRQPVYGLQAAAFAGQTAGASVEEMASRYLVEIRDVQPSGPYRLGGWSMGGLVAWEIARQLRSTGDEVDRLILIDTHDSPSIPIASSEAEETEIVGAAFARHLEKSGLRTELHGDVPSDVRRAFRDNFLAMLRYRAPPAPQCTLLIRAASDETPVELAPWRHLTAGMVEVWDVPTDHWGVVAEPYVSGVGRLVDRFLTEGTVADTDRSA